MREGTILSSTILLCFLLIATAFALPSKNGENSNPLPSNNFAKCVKYRSRTIVNGDSNLNFFQLNYKFVANTLAVNVLNFTSSKPGGENGRLEVYSKDTFSQSCLANSNNPVANCVFRLSNTKKYQFSFRTARFPDGFNMFLAEEVNGTFVLPKMNPCHIEDNPLNSGNPGSHSASTNICCIATPDGSWPEDE